MKETYLSRDFRETVALRFPAQGKGTEHRFRYAPECAAG